MDTLEVAATHAASPSSSPNVSVLAVAPSDEPRIGRWPGWVRLAILLGSGAGLWAGIAWLAFHILKLG